MKIESIQVGPRIAVTNGGTFGLVIAPIASAIAKVDLSTLLAQKILLVTGSTFVSNPINNPAPGTMFSIILVQDAIGGRQVVLDSNYMACLANFGFANAGVFTAAHAATASPKSRVSLLFQSDQFGALELISMYPPIQTPAI